MLKKKKNLMQQIMNTKKSIKIKAFFVSIQNSAFVLFCLFHFHPRFEKKAFMKKKKWNNLNNCSKHRVIYMNNKVLMVQISGKIEVH